MNPLESRKKILITGGLRSGKSRMALSLARESAGTRVFVATAQGFDDEMLERIKKHREERGGDFVTIEEPLFIERALNQTNLSPSVVIIDCLTLWVYHAMMDNEMSLERHMTSLVNMVSRFQTNIIMVTNEVGMGIVPENKLSRKYAEKLGDLNQRMAALCDEVIVMVSGIPQWIKRKEARVAYGEETG